MNRLLRKFYSPRSRNSIPKKWCGKWIDNSGRTIEINSTKHKFYTVSIFDKNYKPYEILLLGNKTKPTTSLTGNFVKDLDNRPLLRVEAGSIDIGPTLDLYFVTKSQDNKLHFALNSDDLNCIEIHPNVTIGLYDDWEDDLGVPWAFPLEPYKKI